MRRYVGRARAENLSRVGADPVLAGLLIVLVVGMVWHLTAVGGIGTQMVVFWLIQAPVNVLAAVLAYRIARRADIARHVRRFWYAVSLTILVLGIGNSVQAVATIADPRGSSVLPGPVQNVCYLVAVLIVTVAGLIYPVAAGSSRDRRRFWFDTVTVLIGASAYEWYFNTGIRATDGGLVDTVEPLFGCGVLLVTAFAVVKLVLSGNGPMGRPATVAIIGAVGVLGITVEAAPALVDSPNLNVLLAAHLLAPILLAVAARLEHWSRSRPAAPPAVTVARRRKPYSKVPYLAIAATNALLIAVLSEGMSARIWGVVIGAVAMTSLAVIRQLDSLSENAELLDQVQHQATHDPLTDLPNRALFTQRLQDMVDGAGGALLLIDLDDFKPINDTLGHHTGDDVLRHVADRLRGCLRPEDTAARLGGDEFAVILPGADAPLAAMTITDRLHRSLAEPITLDGHPLTVRASIGTAVTQPGVGPDTLVREADAAMYHAKRATKPDREPATRAAGTRM